MRTLLILLLLTTPAYAQKISTTVKASITVVTMPNWLEVPQGTPNAQRHADGKYYVPKGAQYNLNGNVVEY